MNEKPAKEKTELCKIKVVILEDNATLVKGMIAELEHDDISVCAFSDDVEKFLENIETYQPDVAIIDLRIWGNFNAGLSGIRDAKKISPDTAYMIHTAYDKIENFHEGINLGIKGFISKNIYEKPLDEIVRIVYKGGAYYGDFLQNYLDKVSEFGTQFVSDKNEQDVDGELLTNKELEVIQLLDKGLSYKKIAATLFISEHTIKAHTRNIRAKFGVNTTKDAVRKYRLRKNR